MCKLLLPQEIRFRNILSERFVVEIGQGGRFFSNIRYSSRNNRGWEKQDNWCKLVLHFTTPDNASDNWGDVLTLGFFTKKTLHCDCQLVNGYVLFLLINYDCIKNILNSTYVVAQTQKNVFGKNGLSQNHCCSVLQYLCIHFMNIVII